MIVVKILGGLGNQMFQYATARRLALKRATGLKLDISAFETYSLHKYALEYLNIDSTIATDADIPKRTVSERFLGRRTPRFLKNRRNYTEKYFHFNPEVLDLPGDVYLDGYWQSEKYFADIRSELLAEFSVKNPLSGKNLETAKLAEGTESVSLHIRRGDYVSNPSAAKIHGACSPDYYRKAVRILSAKKKTPHFFVFSDDLDWARENLSLGQPAQYVDNNDADHGFEDMRLMSLCKHNIIANSSFSWWGAWLNTHVDKTVVAPSRWFSDANLDSSDVLPESWIRA